MHNGHAEKDSSTLTILTISKRLKLIWLNHSPQHLRKSWFDVSLNSLYRRLVCSVFQQRRDSKSSFTSCLKWYNTKYEFNE